MRTNSTAQTLHPGVAASAVATFCAAAGCAAILSLSDGQELKISAILWACLLAAACLPVLLCFRGVTERSLLLALSFTLPISIKVHLLYRTEHMGGAIGLRISITEVLLACLLLACAWRLLGRTGGFRIEFDTPILVALAIYLACAAVSTLLGPAPDLGFYQLTAVVQAFAVFVFVTNYVTNARRLRMCVIGVIVSLAFQSAIAIVQVKKPGLVNLSFLGAAEETEDTVVGGSVSLPTVDRGTTEIAGEIEHRPTGLLIHPNVLAAFLVIAIPMVIGAWATVDSLWFQAICLAAIAMGGIALDYSLSRSGWAGMALALLLVAWFWWRLPLRKPSMARKVIIALVIVACVAGVGMQAQKIYLRLTENADDSVNFRSELAETAWNMAKAHPVFGVGFNSFTEVMDGYDAGGMSRVKKYPAHNVYLLELGEGGFCTGIAFVALVVVLTSRMIRAGKRASDRSLRTFALFTACGVCGFWLTQFSDYVYRIPILTTIVWFHIGLVIAAGRLREAIDA